MRNFNEHTITDAVINRLENTRTPRVQAISTALVKHLHAFVQDVQPTPQEWEQAIDFLTRTGQMCSDTRQEFILLSDVLGVSMLVDAINHRAAGNTTETTVLGPFFVEHAPEVAHGASISALREGVPLLIEGRVYAQNGAVVAGATVDIWHADAEGLYDVQRAGEPLDSRARVRTDEQGNFNVVGVVPVSYPIPDDGPVGQMLAAQGRHTNRPAHVHFMIAAPGHDTLVTHLFLADSDYLDSDVVFGVKDSLIEPLVQAEAGVTPYGAVVERPMAALRRDFVLADQKD